MTDRFKKIVQGYINGKEQHTDDYCYAIKEYVDIRKGVKIQPHINASLGSFYFTLQVSKALEMMEAISNWYIKNNNNNNN